MGGRNQGHGRWEWLLWNGYFHLSKIHIEPQIPNAMVFADGGFGRSLGTDEVTWDGLSVLIRRGRENRALNLCLSPPSHPWPCEDSEKSSSYKRRRGVSAGPKLPCTLILDSAPRIMRTTFLVVKPPNRGTWLCQPEQTNTLALCIE